MDSSVDVTELRAYFAEHPMPNLDEIIALTREGAVIHLWP